MNDIQLKLCDIQGRNGFESSSFIEAFMLSGLTPPATECSGQVRNTCLKRLRTAQEQPLLQTATSLQKTSFTGLTVCTDTGTTIPVKAAEKYTGRRLSVQ